MKKSLVPMLVLAALAVALAGCGGGGKSSSGGGGGGGTPNEGVGANPISVGDCLNNEENFLVQPNVNSIDGQSPAGVGFTLTFFKTAAAAKAAAAKKDPKTTALVENAVVDFKGNPSIYEGAPPAKISKTDLAAMKRCLDKAKAG